MHKHLTDDDHRRISESETFHDLLSAVLGILEKLPKPLVQISGPITTGGRGSMEKNIERIRLTAHALTKRGHKVFDYLVFQESVDKICATYPRDRYCTDVLEVFFRGIFESGHVSKVFFLPDWESSVGSSWERRVALECGLEIIDLPPEWIDDQTVIHSRYEPPAS